MAMTENQKLERKIIEFLKSVEDPEFGVDIYNLGLIYEVNVEGRKAKILMTLTSMGCPTAPMIEMMVRDAACLVDGVDEAEVEWTFEPPWTPELISDEGRDYLEMMGY